MAKEKKKSTTGGSKGFAERMSKLFGSGKVPAASELDVPTHFIDTGSYVLNALVSGSLYGGIHPTKITVLAGAYSTGKTYFLLSCVKSFLDADPDAIVVLVDTENALSGGMLESRGIDPTRVFLPEGIETIEDFKTYAAQLVKDHIEAGKPHKLMLALDSLGMLSTNKEREDTLEDKQVRDMTKSQQTKAAFRVLSQMLGSADIPLIITNHTYDVIGAYVPTKKMSGGSGPEYAASTIIFFSRKAAKDDKTKEVTGEIIHCKADKSRYTRRYKQVDTLLSYDSGLDRYYGLEELAIKHGIFVKLPTQIQLPDGKKVFAKQLFANPTKYYTADVMARLEEAAKAEFCFGSSGSKVTADVGGEAEAEEHAEDDGEE